MEWKILFRCTESDLLFYEQLCLDGFQTVLKGYNIIRKAGSQLGFRHSDESKEKMRRRWLGAKLSEEQKKKIGDSIRGRKHTPEAIERMKEVQAGKIISEETRRKISQTLTGRIGKRGHKLSETHKEKLRVAKLGVKRGPMSEECKAKISAANVGRKRSPEARARMSISAKKRWGQE